MHSDPMIGIAPTEGEWFADGFSVLTIDTVRDKAILAPTPGNGLNDAERYANAGLAAASKQMQSVIQHLSAFVKREREHFLRCNSSPCGKLDDGAQPFCDYLFALEEQADDALKAASFAFQVGAEEEASDV